MKRAFFTLLALAALAASAWAQGTAVVYGTLLKYKNPPGLIADLPSIPREYFVIRFDKPFETEHSNWEYEDGGRAGKVRITEIQVDYNGEDSALKGLIGKKVIAEGGIMERNLANQARALILSVEPGHIKAGAFMLVPEAPTEESAPTSQTARPASTPEIAGGIDYSQEPGLPVEWEEYTIQK